jgi:hypothetical protein
VLPRQFASQKALLDYAEQKGLVYVWAYTQRERWRAKRVAKQPPTDARNE